MGVLWVVERLNSRRREAQLDQAHADLTRRHEEIELLTNLVRRNTVVIERFHATQRRLQRTLDHWHRQTQR